MYFRPIFVVLFFLFLVTSVWAQTPLAANEVYIQNYDTVAKTNDLVYVPISFTKGQYSVAQLDTIQLKSVGQNLVTQVEPTSYYNDGTVRTALAKVLFSSGAGSGGNPAPEQIYQLGTYSGSPPAFQMNANVNDLLKNQNGKSLKVVARDLLGGTYETTLDIDGYGSACQYAGTAFPANCVNLIEDGPVVKVWEIRKENTPQAGAGLTHLFTNIFFVTAVSGKDYVMVDHFLMNHAHLDEQPDPTLSGNMYIYTKPSNGLIFYDDVKLTVNTGTTDHTLFVSDEAYLTPSVLHPKTSNPISTTYDIMPTDGSVQLQTMCAEPPTNCANVKEVSPTISNPSNFIGVGQGFTTRFVIGFSSISAHPLDESKIQSGQSLQRWSATEKFFFQAIPDPDKIDPNYDFDNANNQPNKNNPVTFYNNYIGGWIPNIAHRFGNFDYTYRDLGSTGWNATYQQEPKAVPNYLLSCVTRCRREFLDTLRFRVYASGNVTNNFPGFRTTEHPYTNLNHYRSPAIEGWSNATPSVYSCTMPNGAKDFLGLCQNLSGPSGQQQPAYPPAVYRQDTQGRTMFDYSSATAKPRAQVHLWTMREPAHESLGFEAYRWIFTGDYLARTAAFNQNDTIASLAHYDQHSGQSTAITGRGRGRMLKNMIEIALIRNDPARDRILIQDMVNVIDARRNKQAEGASGTNTFTGDYYPVKYLTSDAGSSVSKPNGGTYDKFQPFEDSQIRFGLGLLVYDYLAANDSMLTQVKSIMKDGLYAWNTYIVKTPFTVRNGTPSLNGVSTYIHEGPGANAQYGTVLIGQTSPDDYATPYNIDDQPQIFPGWCAELAAAGKLRQNDSTFLMNGAEDLFAKYYTIFKDNFDRTFIRRTFDDREYSSVWGVRIGALDEDNVCGLTFGASIPNRAGGGFTSGLYSSSVNVSCPDADNDGFTTCAGDCADTNPNINPGKTETSCTDSTDNNCNGLVDCNDPVCGDPNYGGGSSTPNYNNFCQGTAYCGNLALNGNEQCDVRPGTANAGSNACGGIPNPSPPLNPAYTNTAVGYCVPAFVPNVPGCTCSASLLSFYLNSTTPNTILDNAGATTFTLSGIGFATSNSVEFLRNGSTLVLTKSFNAGSVSCNGGTCTGQVNLTASDISTTLGIGSHALRVKEGANTTNSNTLTINSSTAFTLTNISPNSVTSGVNTPLLTGTGTNFQNGDVLEFTGNSGSVVSATTTFVSATSLTTTLSAANLTTLGVGAGTVRVKRGTSTFSNTQPFTITSSGGLSLTSVNPSTYAQGQTYTDIIFTGTGFQSGDRAQYTGVGGNTAHPASTFVSSTQLLVDVTPGELTALAVGTGTVRVRRGTTTTYSNTVPFTITTGGGSAPTLATIVPSTIAYNQIASLTLTGSNFATPSTVTLGTGANQVVLSNVTPTSATQLDVSLSPAQTQTLNTASANTAAVHNVFVTSNSLNSGTQTLTVTPPVFNSIITPNPATFEYNTNPTIDLSANYYGTSPSVVAGGISFTPSVPSPNVLRFTPTLTQVNTIWGVGNKNIEIQNSGKISQTRVITITDPLPTLASANPTTITWNTSNSITLTGTKFQAATAAYAGSKVNVGAALSNLTPTTVTGNTQLAFSVDAAQSKLLDVGTHQIRVVNGSQTSSATPVVSLTVAHATPTLSTIVPNPISAGQDYLMTLNGGNIHPAAVVSVGTLPDKAATVNTSTNNSLTFNLTSADIATLKGAQAYPFTIPIRIKNDATHVSASLNLTVNAPSGSTAPGSFSVVSSAGTNAGDVNVSWQLAGGTAPVSYTIRGISKATLQTLGNMDAIIDSSEFDNIPVGSWVYNQTDPTNPFTYTGTASTEYCFAAKATNTVGSSYSTTSCVAAQSGQSAPGAFSMSGSPGTNPGDIDLMWTDSSGLPVPRYYLHGILKSDPIAADGTISPAEFDNASVVWAVNVQTTSPYDFSGVPNTEYCFAAKAFNLLGSAYTNTVCVVAKDNAPPEPPAPPGGNSGGGGGGGGGGSGGGGGGGSGSGGNGLTCQPTLELCDGIDNDCDAQIDEGCEEASPNPSNTCTNGVWDAGELDVDCGGVCSQWCVEQNPIPSSFYGFAVVAASPLLVFIQLITFLLGGASFAG